jgi:hypothetical protein
MKINKDVLLVTTKQINCIFVVFFCISLLYSCGVFQNTGSNIVFSKGIPGFAPWLILPFRTNTSVDITDSTLVQFERMLSVQLPTYGIVNSKLTDEKNRKLLEKYSNEQTYIKTTLDFAKIKKADFAIYANINMHEINQSKEHCLGVDLTVYNIHDKSPVWYVNGRRTGHNKESLLTVYRLLIIDLLKMAPIGDYNF